MSNRILAAWFGHAFTTASAVTRSYTAAGMMASAGLAAISGRGPDALTE